MAAQKTLIQQLQEADAEARELQDFMQVQSSSTYLQKSPPPLNKNEFNFINLLINDDLNLL